MIEDRVAAAPTRPDAEADAEATATAKVVPLRRQYLQIKRRFPDTILFFRLGDFYETFDDDARLAADFSTSFSPAATWAKASACRWPAFPTTPPTATSRASSPPATRSLFASN